MGHLKFSSNGRLQIEDTRESTEDAMCPPEIRSIPRISQAAVVLMHPNIFLAGKGHYMKNL